MHIVIACGDGGLGVGVGMGLGGADVGGDVGLVIGDVVGTDGGVGCCVTQITAAMIIAIITTPTIPQVILLTICFRSHPFI